MWIGLSVVILLLISWTDSSGTENEMVEVPASILVEARELIDKLEYQVAIRDSTIAAQREYYTTLLDLQDTRIEALEKLVRKARGSPFERLVDNASWLMIGYGVRAATE